MSKCSLFLMIGIFILSFSAKAATISLDRALAEQQTTVISPVTFQGKNIVGMNAENAASVCAALGYLRLVDYSTEPCQDGKALFKFMNNALPDDGRGGSSGYYLSKYYFQCHIKQYGENYDSKSDKQLVSVTCAK